MTAALVQFLVRNDFYVIIDNHFEDTTITSSPSQWVTNWSGIMADIIKDAPSTARVLVDLYNEPDAHGFTWSTVSHLFSFRSSLGWSPHTQLSVACCPVR